eukprot:gene9904-18502_t
MVDGEGSVGVSTATIEFLRKSLKYLRDKLKKCMDRRSKLTKSGAAASSLPTCNYYEQILFLVEGVSNYTTESKVESLVEEHQNNVEEPPSPSPNQSLVLVEPTAKKQWKEAGNRIPAAKSQKIDEQKLSKGVENDILKHFKDVNDALNEKPPVTDLTVETFA